MRLTKVKKTTEKTKKTQKQTNKNNNLDIIEGTLKEMSFEHALEKLKRLRTFN